MSARQSSLRVLAEAAKLIYHRSTLHPATLASNSELLSNSANLRRELASPGKWRGFSQLAREEVTPSTSQAHEETPAKLPEERSSDANVANESSQKKKFELVAAFTCNKCGTRSVRAFSKVAYERGVVLARCGGCQVQHVLADRLGWFGKEGSIEDFLKEKGESVRSYKDGTMELSEEDLLGWTSRT